jgi:hypothetical protein
MDLQGLRAAVDHRQQAFARTVERGQTRGQDDSDDQQSQDTQQHAAPEVPALSA